MMWKPTPNSSLADKVTTVFEGKTLLKSAENTVGVPSTSIITEPEVIVRLASSPLPVLNAQLILPSPSKSSTQYGPSRPTKACTSDAPMVMKESSVLSAPPAGILSGKSFISVGKPSVSSSAIASSVNPDSMPPVTPTVCTGPISNATLPVTCTNSEICSVTFSTLAPIRWLPSKSIYTGSPPVLTSKPAGPPLPGKLLRKFTTGGPNPPGHSVPLL